MLSFFNYKTFIIFSIWFIVWLYTKSSCLQPLAKITSKEHLWRSILISGCPQYDHYVCNIFHFPPAGHCGTRSVWLPWLHVATSAGQLPTVSGGHIRPFWGVPAPAEVPDSGEYNQWRRLQWCCMVCALCWCFLWGVLFEIRMDWGGSWPVGIN